jgi:hypothetical protein
MFDIITVLLGLLLVVSAYGVYLLFRGWLLLPSEDRGLITVIGILALVCLLVIGYINMNPELFVAG